MTNVRHRPQDVQALYTQPFPNLVFSAMQVHRSSFDPLRIQRSTLLSIKTGGCSEDCRYCGQSARYKTPVIATPLMAVDDVMTAARSAKENGATRFCMGAAWPRLKDGPDFERVLEMVRGVTALGLEACVTLGRLRVDQALRLREAGLIYYNHNLDTSESYYDKVITTRRYEDRLATLASARTAGLKLCCGGIIGLGESRTERISLLCELANLEQPPESVPINVLVPIEGTPLAAQSPIEWLELVRAIATARILMPSSMLRLSAGRATMGAQLQTLCFLVGANSIFTGEHLLTTQNAAAIDDESLLRSLGMNPQREGSERPTVLRSY